MLKTSINRCFSNLIPIIGITLFITMLNSCGKIRNKTEEVSDKVTEKTEGLIDKTEKLTDKIISKTEEITEQTEQLTDKVISKTEEIAEKVRSEAKNTLDEQIERVIDEVFLPCDYVNPDDKNNKKRFRSHLKIEITSDIRNVYCFDDEIAIDADYMFAFNCNSSTSDKIIQAHELTPDKFNQGNLFNFQDDFDWWDKGKIASLKRFSWTNNTGYYKYYWYDLEEEKAYFFTFDM